MAFSGDACGDISAGHFAPAAHKQQPVQKRLSLLESKERFGLASGVLHIKW